MKSSTKAKSKSTFTKQVILGKIRELFQYRQIPHLLDLSKIKNRKGFNSKLQALQLTIYLLDDYLEHNWNLDDIKLKRLWEQIDSCLHAFGLAPDEIRDYCKQIVRYQSHEASMREGLWSTRYTIKYFYYYKSCDVKLLRRLLYREDPNLESILAERDWRSYDLITEINDDIEDVFEDMEIFNANRFLVSLLQKGKRQTKSEYLLFLREMKMKNRNPNTSGGEQGILRQLTINRIHETIQLLNHQMANIDLKSIKKALISSKMVRAK